MATLNFPSNPVNGQLYPSNPLEGEKVYQYDAANLVWELLGSASGVIPGSYTNANITVDITGIITDASSGSGSGGGTLQEVTDNGSTTTNTIVVTVPNTAAELGPGSLVLENALAPTNPTLRTNATSGVLELSGSNARFSMYDLGVGGQEVVNISSGVGSFTSGVNVGSLTNPGILDCIGGLVVRDTSYTRFIVDYVTGSVFIGNTDLAAGGTPRLQISSAGFNSPTIELDGNSQTITVQSQSLFGTFAPTGIEIAGSGTSLSTNLNAGELVVKGTGGGIQCWPSGGAASPSIVLDSTNGSLEAVSMTVANLIYPTVDGSAGEILVTDGAGNLSFTTVAGVSNTLQDVTNNGSSTTNSMQFVDPVSSNTRITIDPSSATLSVLPVSSGDPGVFLGPTSVAFGDSTGSLFAGGSFPSSLQFYGSQGVRINSATGTSPIVLSAGGSINHIVINNAATTIDNQLIASGLNYPTVDGIAGSLLGTDGNGNLNFVLPTATINLQQVTDVGSTTDNTIIVQDTSDVTQVAPSGITIDDDPTNPVLNTVLEPGGLKLSGASSSVELYDAINGTQLVDISAGVGTFYYGMIGTNGGVTVNGDISVNDGVFDRFNVDKVSGVVQVGNPTLSAGGTGRIELYSPGFLNGPTVEIDANSQSVTVSTPAYYGELTPTSLAFGTTGTSIRSIYLNGASGEIVGDILLISGILYPTSDGNAGQVMYTDGGNNLGWSPGFTVGTAATTITNQLIANNLSYPTVDGNAGDFLSTDGAGNLSFVPASAATPDLQDVTDAGSTTTNTISVSGGGNIETTFDGAAGGRVVLKDGVGVSQVVLYPDGQGISVTASATQSGVSIAPGSIAFSDSLGTLSSGGAYPSSLQFDGQNGVTLRSASVNTPIYLSAGANQDQFTLTDTTTTITNQLIVDGLIYPASDGTVDQVMNTDGAGNLGWMSTAKWVSPPVSSAASGTLGEVSFASGFFYWYDGTQWLRAAGSTF